MMREVFGPFGLGQNMRKSQVQKLSLVGWQAPLVFCLIPSQEQDGPGTTSCAMRETSAWLHIRVAGQLVGKWHLPSRIFIFLRQSTVQAYAVST